MPKRATPNRTELAALHDKIAEALTHVLDAESAEMGLSDLEAGLLWCELREVQLDVVGAMFGQPPAYLRAQRGPGLRLVTGTAAGRIPRQRDGSLARQNMAHEVRDVGLP